MVIVNTVVYVQAELGRPEPDVAVALALFGGGSMLAALLLPRLLDRLPDRAVMLTGAAMLAGGMLFMGVRSLPTIAGWPILLTAWFIFGLGYSAVLTPTGRLLRRSSHGEQRPALFAAQFALSHLCWLLTYPLVGWIGAELGMAPAFLVLGALTTFGAILAPLLWPLHDPEVLDHVHEGMTPDHPHVRGAESTDRGLKRAHAFIIDDYHQHWPA